MPAVNTLVAETALRAGPLVLETLIKHYFARLKRDSENKAKTKLSQEDLLYDQAFTIIKAFLNEANLHTVEEVQGFSNARTPAPPWVKVVRVLVPLVSCDKAAEYIVAALGGPDAAKRVVGGIKWWQVRGLKGVDGQWICTKKDYQEAKRRYKAREAHPEVILDAPDDSGVYERDMDEMRCILYLHGGGYYFGSVDQERYSIQRFARKINGRVFAINYRLAPQYPFPCALQDALAAYLYLIRPPSEASHKPVDPAHIVIGGDSAGGGLTLALLQVIRDTPDLPKPAGGLLISPWCDLTHSFPSIHTNTATDVIPDFGLSFQKPSTLWPPPSADITSRVHAGLRHRIRQVFHSHGDPGGVRRAESRISREYLDEDGPALSPGGVEMGRTTPLPALDQDTEVVMLRTKSGEELSLDRQVHLYTQNSLIGHPLVSPALSYLGGLPPLLFIVSDKEVLRDEDIYTAHRAAYPERFPVRQEAKDLYPALNGIEERFGRTPVHLQVYDDTAHILPILFPFTTPAKFCFRAIATFCKYVTGMPLAPAEQSSPSPGSSQFMDAEGGADIPRSPTQKLSKRASIVGRARSTIRKASLSRAASLPRTHSESRIRRSTVDLPPSPARSAFAPPLTPVAPTPPAECGQLQGAILDRPLVPSPLPSPCPSATNLSSAPPRSPAYKDTSHASSDVGGARFHRPAHISQGELYPGNPAVYGVTSSFERGSPPLGTWNGDMIRERVATSGVIRPLEPESELPAFQIDPDAVGRITELTVRRFIDGKARYGKKYDRAMKGIERERKRLLERARKQTAGPAPAAVPPQTDKPSWGWGWALDGERPPPSSVAARRDTEEAMRLARIADEGVFQREHVLSGNNLWSVVVNYLTAGPERRERRKSETDDEDDEHQRDGEVKAERGADEKVAEKHDESAAGRRRGESALRTRLSAFLPREKHAKEKTTATTTTTNVDVPPVPS
ncbi:Alpha/Beta hydrolase protein [Schizophyllum fasciatum]